jgi:PAS domain S-box-containing protein
MIESEAPLSFAPAEVQELQQCCADVARLTGMPAEWTGRAPQAIAASLIETLLDMLDLDLAGLRFDDATSITLAPDAADGTEAAVQSWLDTAPDAAAATLHGAEAPLFTVSLPLGGISSLGRLFAVSRRTGFPRPTELLRLKVAAGQAGLVLREMRAAADRRAEAPAESERRHNLVINTIPAMVWSSTPDGMVDLLNQHLLDFVGLPAEQVLGLGFQRIFHPDDAPILLGAWQEIMATKRPREVEGRIRSAEGRYRWFLFRQRPLLDATGDVVKWFGVILDIEDRKRAEDALNAARSALLASEQNLRLIVDSLPVLAWGARPDGSADFVSRQWAEYAGVPAQQILEWGFLDFYHPDDIPGMVAVWKDALATKDNMTLKGRIRRHDGAYRWFLFAGQKIVDANGVVRWIGANVDIEDLQRAEDALRASEQRLKLTIDTIPAMSWSATADGMVDYWSKSLLDYCGLQFEEVEKEGFYRIFHVDDLEPARCSWERVRAARRGEEVDLRIRRADGEYRWFTLRQNPLLDGKGEVMKWYGALFEVEDRKRTEEELRQSQTELARITRMTTLGELAVSIAHEVNQPLMAIVTNAGTCLRWLDPAQFDADQAREAAARIVRDGHRAGEIITSIRALARKSPPSMEPMDLKQAVRDVLLLMQHELRRRGVEAELQASGDPLAVLGDRTQLQQVLLNLIMNAVEAMADTAPDERRITIGVDADGGFGRVSVLDAGAGLGADSADRVFEAFFSTKLDGLGMGLSICRSIVEAHRGTISAAGNLPRGSVFSFTVPMTAGASPQ